MEGAKTVSVGAVYVPNSYLIHLGTEDFEPFKPLKIFGAEVDQVAVRHVDGTHTHGLGSLHLAQQAPADLGGLDRGAESLGEEAVDDSLQPAFKIVEEPQVSSKTSR